jgi:hypothetical protein
MGRGINNPITIAMAGRIGSAATCGGQINRSVAGTFLHDTLHARHLDLRKLSFLAEVSA